jgi:S-DNA-T family DNA segregation ATPase FtsK/SpoIIIE
LQSAAVINTSPNYRSIAIWLAVALGFCGILLVFSLFSVLFGIGPFAGYVGRFFARSFGILSLFIPAYFTYAAIILADPRWRPDRIFLLSASIFPFLTIGIGYTLIREFDVRALQFAFLDFLGKTGFTLFIISITVLEILALQVIKSRLFQKNASLKNVPVLPSPETVSVPLTQTNITSGGEDLSDLEYGPANPLTGSSSIAPAGEFSDISDFEYNGSGASGPANAAPAEVFAQGVTGVYAEKIASNLDALLIDPTVEYEIEEKEDDVIGETIAETIAKEEEDSIGVQKALKEAEAAAEAHAEQVRKKQVAKSNYAKKYKVPIDILNEYPDGEYWVIDQATRDAALALKETLEEFKIQAEVTGIRKGPVITMFEILPAPGVKLSKIAGLQDNIALRLAASSVRIVAPIPGKHAVGIEVPNLKRNLVSFRELIEGELQSSDKKMEIPIVLGKDITGEAQTVDLVSMPHLLIAGATGSGKSVCVNTMILSILYQLHPSDCRLILIDPKIVELKLYNDIPHLLTPVITEPKKAFQALQYCIYEMERRYACLDSVGVRDIRSYNKRIKEKNIAQEHLPYIVVVIDEFADLMSTTGKELESTVARLAAMSRAVGIHLVLATQRPSIDVITGLIKANIPSRIAFMVASKTDSRIIIDTVGAEKLLGKGDMLYAGVVDPFPIRMQGAFISEEEVEAVVEHVKGFGEPEYIDDEIFFEEEEEELGASLFSEGDDPLYEKALEIVMQQGKASASYIQRRLKIGFNRAARLVDEMESHGVVGPAQGSKPRELLRAV